jgi:hypothetical protein
MDHVDTPLLHIGSDEVRVRNPQFMDHIADLVRKRGRQVLAWRPGNPPSGRIITQMWSCGPGLDALPGMAVVAALSHASPTISSNRLLNGALDGSCSIFSTPTPHSGHRKRCTSTTTVARYTLHGRSRISRSRTSCTWCRRRPHPLHSNPPVHRLAPHP